MHIGHIRKNLPKLLREKIGARHTDWTEFLNAIQDINIDHIWDGVDAWKKEQADHDTVKKRIKELEKLVTTSPTAPICQQMSMFGIRNQTNTATSVQQGMVLRGEQQRRQG